MILSSSARRISTCSSEPRRSICSIRGINVSDLTYQFLLLLAASPSQSLPTLLFTRPFSAPQTVNQSTTKLTRFDRLFRKDKYEGEVYIEPEQNRPPLSMPGYDWQYGAHQLGSELEALRREQHVEVTHQEEITFVEMSHDTRQEIWLVFAKEPKLHRKVQSLLCTFILLALPVPYAEPLWEMTSFACKDVITSTLLPFLFTSPGLRDFQQNLMTEEISCLLVFHLTNLGFALDDARWDLLFDNSQSSNVKSFFKIHKEISYLLGIPSSDPQAQNWKSPREFDLPQTSLGASLLGFTIAQIPWKCSSPTLWAYFETWRSCWSNSYTSRKTDLEKVAYAVIYPESINVSELASSLPSHSIYALAIGLSHSGHLETSSSLLKLGLLGPARDNLTSHVYELLFAELLKYLTLLGKAKDASDLGIEYLKVTTTHNAYVPIATTDAFIALGNYKTAQERLQYILSDTSLSSFEEICLVLCLNKIWRRRPDLIEPCGFADNLARIVNSIRREDNQIQEDYMTELQATVYHVRGHEEPIPPRLHTVIEHTLKLYREDDGTLQKQRATLDALIKTDNTASEFTIIGGRIMTKDTPKLLPEKDDALPRQRSTTGALPETRNTVSPSHDSHDLRNSNKPGGSDHALGFNSPAQSIIAGLSTAGTEIPMESVELGWE